MCIKHNTHCSVESVTERGASVPSLSQCVTQVDGLSKLEQRTRTDQGLEDRGHPSRWPEDMFSETSTAQHIIYNIKQGCLELVSSCENASTVVPWSSSSPPPTPQENKHPQPTQKCLPIKFPITSVPRDRFHGQSPSKTRK